MKEIILKINDDVYDRIKSEVTVYNLAWAGGRIVPIQFLSKIIDAIEKDEKEIEMKYKDKR